MKFYAIQHKGSVREHLGLYISPVHAMGVIDTMADTGMDVSGYCVQEYEGWATCMSWKYGEKFERRYNYGE